MEGDIKGYLSEIQNDDEEVFNGEESVEEILETSWERKRRETVIHVVGYVVYTFWLLSSYCHTRRLGRLSRSGSLEAYYTRERRCFELMNDLKVLRTCRGLLRMSPSVFFKLCEALRGGGYLSDTKRASVEEQVAKTLHILGHNTRNIALSFFFKRSGETVSHHFHRVLNAIISMEDQFLKQPHGSEDVPSKIRSDDRFFPYFKDCIGAIDGTHIRVKVSNSKAKRFRSRKGYPSHNILAVCTFDLKFTYVLEGWEGTTSDSRIFKNALVREDRLVVPEGKYYLSDAGYMLKSFLITPYGGVRYHLKEYTSCASEILREWFNLRHASLPNTIERAFGVLNKRFAIIGGTNEPHYSRQTRTKIILACCIIHNFIMGVEHDHNLSLIEEVDHELEAQEEEEEGEVASNREDSVNGAIIRDKIVEAMWDDYVL